MRNPPILIAVLGFFALLAGFGFLFLGLRLIGFDWFGLFGDLPALEHVGIWGWLALVTGVVWLLAAFGLWLASGLGVSRRKEWYIAAHYALLTWFLGALVTACQPQLDLLQLLE